MQNSTSDIKKYLKNNFCTLCFSSGRRLTCDSNLFHSKFLELDPQEDKICWECNAKLQNIQNFFNKSDSARTILSEAILALHKGEDYVINSLSTLSIQNLIGENILPNEALSTPLKVETLSTPLKVEIEIEKLQTTNDENAPTNIAGLNILEHNENCSGALGKPKSGKDIQLILKGKPSLILKKIEGNRINNVANIGNNVEKNFAFPISKCTQILPIKIEETSIKIVNNVIIRPFAVSNLQIPVKYIQNNNQGENNISITKCERKSQNKHKDSKAKDQFEKKTTCNSNKGEEFDYESFIPEIELNENDLENTSSKSNGKRKRNEMQTNMKNIEHKVSIPIQDLTQLKMPRKPVTNEVIERKKPKVPKRYAFETMRIYEELTSKYIDEEELNKLREMDRNNPSYLGANYKCEKCIFGYKEEGYYLEHLNKHELWFGGEMCTICELRFKDVASLENHRKSHFIGFFCTKCSFASRFLLSVTAHYKTEHRPPADHCCQKCDAVFRTEAELLSHIEIGHGKPCCLQCGETFRNLYLLKLHVQKVHEQIMFDCPVCKKQFNCENYLKQHVKVVHNKPKNDDPSQDPRYYCKECNKFFKQSSYKIHLTTSKAHAGDNFKFVCSDCGQRFATRPRLRRHVEKMHLHITNAECDICGKKCYNQNELRKHIKGRHKPRQETDRTHMCSICGKGFFSPATLSQHMMTHTGEKPYPCPYCEFRGAQKTNIINHCKYKHKDKPPVGYTDIQKQQ